jgi:hypothetical protein
MFASPVGRRLAGFGRPPVKGSLRRSFLLQALSTQGISCQAADVLFRGKGKCRAAVACLINEKGYDLRAFKNGDRSQSGIGAPHKSWRLVGKMRWDGSYRSFINPEA